MFKFFKKVRRGYPRKLLSTRTNVVSCSNSNAPSLMWEMELIAVHEERPGVLLDLKGSNVFRKLKQIFPDINQYIKMPGTI